MKDRHLRQERKPRGGAVTSWARVPDSDGAVVTYRLFRRDMARAWHYHFERFTRVDCREVIAATLRRMKRALRDRVDELDLARMEKPA